MLVLSRRKEQKIIIGGVIEITVNEIRADKVMLGITAPKDITVHRKEIHDQIERGKIKHQPLKRFVDQQGG